MPVKCPMCLTDVEKLKSDSHVLPKFFLRPIRDSNGQTRTVDVFKAIIDTKSQDLPKGTYICPPCETFTAKLDGYGAKILTQMPDANINSTVVLHEKVFFEYWDGLDFQQYRNFLLSIVIRDHCWRKSTNLPSIMTDTEFEAMRSLLMSPDSTDDKSFRIVVHRVKPVALISSLHKTTSPPAPSVPKDAVTFMGLGFAFMVYFKKPVQDGMTIFADTFGLKSSGSVKMPMAELFNIGTWKHSEQAIVGAYRKWEEKKWRKRKP